MNPTHKSQRLAGVAAHNLKRCPLMSKFAVILLLCGSLNAQIAFHAAADLGNNGGSTSSYTHAYTTGSGANRLLLVCLAGDPTKVGTITGVTYAGTNMTLVGQVQATYMFYLLHPPIGSNNVVVSASTSQILVMTAADYSGVRQSGQPDASTTNTGLGMTITTSLTTTANNAWATLCLQGFDAGKQPSAGSGATLRASDATFGTISIYDSNAAITPPKSYSMTAGYPDPSSSGLRTIMASFAPVVPPSTTFKPAPFPGPNYTVSTSNPVGVVVGEFDSCYKSVIGCPRPNDGNLDLAVANLGGKVDILTGNGDGTFNGPFPFSAGRGPRSIAQADFNGDGLEDLVVVNSYTGINVLLDLLGVLLPVPAGGYTAGATPESVAVGDFNGDTCPDIAVTNNGDNTVSIFLNNCDGTILRMFTPVVPPVPVGLGPTGIAVGNFFKGDPNLDLAVVNSSDATVSILKGDGTGKFSLFGAPITLGKFGRTLDLGQVIAVADLNRDGNQDIVIAADLGVVVLLGNGNGTFGAPTVYPADRNPDGIAIADFNGDGFLDLAVTNAFSNDLSVLIGKGDGTFPNPPANFQVGSFPTAVAAGDFNNDGRQDVAITNFGDNTVTVLLGTQWNITTCAALGGPPFCPLSAPPQATQVNTQFPLPLVARVTDAFNNPVQGAVVTFSAPTSGPSATFSPSTPQTTNANGEVHVRATANGISGPAYLVTATAGFSATATFTLTNKPGIPSIAAVGGTPQSANVGTTFPSNLQARLTDSNGVGISGAAVVFTVTSGVGVPSGTFPGGVTTITISPTDSNGIAATPFTANTTPGTYLVNATAFAAGAPDTAVFVLTNTGPPASITAAAGTPQSVGLGNPFHGALVARVTDGLLGTGNPVQGALVTFTVHPVNGAGGTFGVATTVMEATDSTGSATTPTLTANNVGGTYTVTASVAGVVQNAVFNLTNVGGSGALLPGDQTIRQNDSPQFQINLGTPAPAGGVIVSLSSSNPSVVTVSPANILIPAGSMTSRGLVTLNALSVGVAQVTATAYGFVPDSTITVTVIPPLPQ